MRETKHRMESFSFYDRTGLERHLARMAERGWLLEKIGPFLWTYRRTAPKTLAFSVCYFPKASQFDPGPSEEQQTFYDFCEHTGWILAASSAQLQVFYNERPGPIPIETDPVTEVDAIHRTMKRSLLPSQLVLLAVAILNTGMLVSDWLRDPIKLLASPAYLLDVACWAIMFLLIAVELGGYFLWHRRAVRAAVHGEFLETKSHRKLQAGSLIVLAGFLVYFLSSVLSSGNRTSMAIMVLMFCVYAPSIWLVILGVRGFLKRKQASARFNMIATIASAFVICYALLGVIAFVVLSGSAHGWFRGEKQQTYEAYGTAFTLYQDELPLTLEDLTGQSYDQYTRERKATESFLLARYSMLQCPRFGLDGRRGMAELTYTITLVKVPFLYGLCKDYLFRSQEERGFGEAPRYFFQAVDAAPWGAVEAYQSAMYQQGEPVLENSFLLCYPDRLVCVSFYWDCDVTPEQMAIVGERLGQGNP